MKRLFALFTLLLLAAPVSADPLINWSATTAVQASTVPTTILNFDPNRVCLMVQNTSATIAYVTFGATCNNTTPNGWALQQYQWATYCNFEMTNAPPRRMAMNTQSVSVCTQASTANLVYQYAD